MSIIIFHQVEMKVTVKSERGGRPLVAPWSGPWQSANPT